MRKIILILVVMFFQNAISAQEFLGLTQNGISKLNAGTGDLSSVVDLTSAEYSFLNNMTEGSDGKFYGMTYYGGISGVGILFSYDPTTDIYTRKYEFDNTSGGYPYGSLTAGSDGKFYGMTSSGGTSGAGVIFSYDPVTNTYAKKYDFSSINGRSPYGNLTAGSDGKFYGMTVNGGTLGYGVIFSYDPVTNTYAKKFDFDNTNGRSPYGSLTPGSDGKFYGMTSQGGTSDFGVIFSYDPTTDAYTKKYNFDNINGRNPYGSLTAGSDGKFYGMTIYGGTSGAGVIFSYDPITDTYAKKYNFDFTNGAYPYGSLTAGSDGKFYGMTSSSGASNGGVIFSYDPVTSTYAKKFDLGSTNGANPSGSLTAGSDGKFYGMTNGGGTSSAGVIFSYDPVTNMYAKKFDFGNTNGGYPYGSLTAGSDGKFYGMTYRGGTINNGVIFSYDPVISTYSKKFDFNNTNGIFPYGSLTAGSDGKLYGMTNSGGASGYGVIFSYDPATNTYVRKYDFDNTNGANPYGNLTAGSDGKFYGMTTTGGPLGYGVIFSYDPATNTYARKYNFDNTNGRRPYGSLTADSDGKLYGMTVNGGPSGAGVIFSYDPVTNTYAKKFDFDVTNGGYPYGSLTAGSDGKFYGMTTNGGPSGYGVIFSYDPATNTYVRKYDFDFTNGGYPQGSLTAGSDGKFYGMTSSGGSSRAGVAFSFSPTTNQFQKLAEFNGKNGRNPVYGAWVEIPAGPCPCLPPVITSFSPANGPVGSALTITGSRFNAVPGNNIVYLGAVRAVVTSGTTTSLTISVPAGATYQPISVLNNELGLTGYSATPFVTTFTNPFGTGIPVDFCKPKVDITTGDNSFSVALGDIDGDGKPDMAVANYFSNKISVLRNISSLGTIDASSFASAVEFATDATPSSVTIADLDGDGKPELVVGHRSSNTVSVFRNTAVLGNINAASFSSKVDFIIGSSTFSVAIRDIDGDGKPDLVAANFDANTISVLRNVTSPGDINASSFAEKVDYPTGPNPAFVAISDLDGDGKPDLAVTNYSAFSISVLRNTSTTGIIDISSFAEKVDFVTEDGPYSIAVGDLDGDDKPDLVVPNSNSGNLSILRNVSVSGIIDASSFANKVDFSAGNHSVSVAIGDLDGDGKPDLAVANQYSSDISLLHNASNAGSIDVTSFAPAVNIATGAEPITIAIGDLDGDGAPEIVTSNFTSSNTSVFKISEPLPPVITSFSPSNGPVGTNVTITGYNFNEAPQNNTVYFGAVRAVITSGTSNSLSVIVPAGATYQPISVLNNEKARTGYSATPFVTTFTNPFGTDIPADFYKPAVHFASGLAPHSIVFGDLDGDGKPDMVVANRYSSSISLYGNISTTGTVDASSFAAPIDIANNADATTVSIGDLDGDGKPDLAIGYRSTNYVSVMRNIAAPGTLSTSSFEPSIDFTTGSGTFSTAIKDVDQDGKPELVVVNHDVNTISVLRNTSVPGSINAASFATKVDYPTGTNPAFVAFDDLDGDGKPDMAVTNYNSNSISVIRNTSSSGSIDASSFAAKVDFQISGIPFSIAISDLDGDGKPDIAAPSTNPGSLGNLAVFRNTSTTGDINASSFAPEVGYPIGENSPGVAIGDLDGDGKPDVVVANQGSSDISVLRNTATSGNLDASSFAASVLFTGGNQPINQPISIAIGDLDGDGIPELASSNFYSSDISVFRVNSTLLITLDESVNVTCYGGNQGKISVTVTGGIAPYTFAWTRDEDLQFGSTSEDIIDLKAGNYHLTVTDAIGSTETYEISLSEPDLLESSASGTNNNCYGDSQGTATIIASGGTLPYSYQWSNSASTDEVTNLSAGLYSVTIFDNNGCSSVAIIEITQPPLLTAVTNINSTSCSNIGSVYTTGGTAPYSYLWSNGAITDTIKNVPAGTYNVVVTDGNGCTVSASVILTLNDAFNPSAQVIDVSCYGNSDGSITVTNVNGTAPFSYSLDGIVFQTGNVFNNLPVGNYIITVVDANGCTGFISKSISQPPALTVTLNNVQSTCFGTSTGAISISASGGSGALGYGWTGPNGFTSTRSSLTNLATGTYSLTVTDNNACKTTLGVVVPSLSQITVNPTVTNLACKGQLSGAISLNVTGGTGSGFTYNWTGPVGFTATTSSISNLSIGNYSVAVTDIGSGCVVTQGFSITQPTLAVSLTASKTNSTGCGLGTITATGSGGTGPYQYRLNEGPYQSSGFFSGLAGALPVTGIVYTVWVRDANGCTKSAAVTITDNGSDLYESNNSKAQAKVINVGSSISARIALATDLADWFRFTTVGAGKHILTLSHGSVNYNFNLFAAGNNTPALTPSLTSATTKEYVLTANTSYFIRITGSTSYSCYQLSVTTPLLTTSNSNSLSSSGTKLNNALDVKDASIDIKAYPNPSNSQFTLKISSLKKDPIQMKVTNIQGSVMEIRSGIYPNSNIQLGSKYPAGVYFVEIRQGKDQKQLKLIKL